MFLAAGFAVVFTNYRGSLGYGEDSVNSLPGRCGDRDVRDCLDSLDAAAAASPSPGLNLDRVVAWGGSHAGLIGGHLLARFPTRFAAACLRNPVIDVAAMISATDIPDWCLTEGTGKQYDPCNPVPSAEDHARMFAASPASVMHQIRSPVLLGLGRKDLRVPPFNAPLLMHALRASGVPARLLSYPEDSHPMSSLEADTDYSANALAWIRYFV